MAATACDTGKVKFDGLQAKASRNVSIGDEYEVKTEAKRWRIKVTGLLEKRVAHTEAIKNYLDITPEEELERIKSIVLKVRQPLEREWLLQCIECELLQNSLGYNN